MVTVVDPNGTPTPVYTRSGTTLETMAAGGDTFATANPIVSLSGWTVVIVQATVSNQAVILPEGATIGDVVEIYPDGGLNLALVIFAPSGEFIRQSSATASMAIEYSSGHGRFLRKVSNTEWRANAV